jgi:hypothetical protein
VRRHNHAWFDDVRARLRFEREAQRENFKFKGDFVGRPRRPRYRVAIDVPTFDDRRQVTVVIDSVRSPSHPVVHLDGPVCLRHRFPDRSLCMWLNSDSPENKWVAEDGLLKLVGHIKEHAWCEATCREGRPWPKDEAPGDHPRPKDCPSCGGRGQ